MKLKSLHLNNFKKFKEITVDFCSGINVVYGDNEQGKSTIIRAILTVLFLDAKTKSQALFEKITSWNEKKLPILELKYEFEGEEFLLTRDFQNKLQSLNNLTKDKIISEENSSIVENLKKHIGIGDDQVFRLTALVAQNDIARVGAKTEKSVLSLKESIDASLSGVGEISVNDILKKLDTSISDLNKGVDRLAKYPGIIKNLSDRLEDLKKKKTEISGYLSSSEDYEDIEKDSDVKLKEISKEIEELENLIKNDEIRNSLEKRLKELNSLIDDLEKRIVEVERFETKLKFLEEERKAFEINSNPKDLKEKLNKINILIEEKEGSLISLNEKLDFQEDVFAKGRSKRKVISFSILGLTAFAYILSFIFLSFNLPILILAIIIALSSVLYGFSNLLDKSESSENISEQITEIESSIETLNEDKKNILSENDITSESELSAMILKVESYDTELQTLKSKLEALTNQKNLSQLKDLEVEYFREKKDIEQNKLNDEIKSSFIDPMEKYSKTQHLNSLKYQQSELKESLMKAQISLKSATYNQEDLSAVEEQIFDLEKQLNYFQHKLNILTNVKDFISKSRIEVLSKSGDVITEFAGKYLSQITKGKYSKLRMTEDFQYEIFSEEKDDWISPDDNLSQGAIDQVYLVIRFALLSVICKDKNPPLIFDDPFVTFDESRNSSVKSVLEEISSKYQVILLTCHKEFSDWGNFITLPK